MNRLLIVALLIVGYFVYDKWNKKRLSEQGDTGPQSNDKSTNGTTTVVTKEGVLTTVKTAKKPDFSDILLDIRYEIDENKRGIIENERKIVETRAGKNESVKTFGGSSFVQMNERSEIRRLERENDKLRKANLDLEKEYAVLKIKQDAL